MPEIVAKQTKIFSLAKDINVAATSILDFLKEEGFNVKTIMSPLDDEMLTAVTSHFKKDRDNKEKREKKTHEREEHNKEVLKKIDEKKANVFQVSRMEPQAHAPLQKKRTRKVEEPAPVETKIELPIHPIVEETIPTQEIIEEISHPKRKVSPSDIPIPQQEQEPPENKITQSAPTVDPGSEAGTAESISEKKKKKKPIVSGLERVRGERRGLTVVGRIELKEKKAPTPTKPATSVSDNDVVKKKKRKRKVKEDKVVEQDDLVTKAKKQKKHLRDVVDEREVVKTIVETFAVMGGGTGISGKIKERKHRKEKKRAEAQQRILDQEASEKTLLRVTEYVSVSELANLMRVNVAEVISKCIGLGKMVSINQRLEKDIIELVADEFGRKIEFQKEYVADELADSDDPEPTLKPRPPIVTIMGHVDHGKTSLLDYIRETTVVAGEAGGITQHIGAYEVTLKNEKQITFLDTPGHEAFTAMRARGAQVTDIVILVVAADDSVMPQTIEAISHAQAANVPIIIAINKMDKPGANSERIRQQLSKKNVLVEEWGGKYQSMEISAKTGKNVDALLEKVLLEAEILSLRANPVRKARGTVIEAKLDKGKGTVVTVLVLKGTLRVGDSFVSGFVSGRVRAMFDERGNRVEAAHPSTPVQVTGFDAMPQAGDEIVVVESEKVARDISLQRSQLKREQDFRQRRLTTLDDISKEIKEGRVRDLNVLIKGDVDGSVEALGDSLLRLSTSEVRVNVVYRAVGAITETDVLLAAASRAIIIGFNVRPNLSARRLASVETVDIRVYNIIYNAINEVKQALEGLLAPEVKEEITATVAVRDVFKLSKGTVVAGCYVEDGTVSRNGKVRLVRDGIVVFDGGIFDLKRFKDDVKEVQQGFECGISLNGFNDIKVGDVIESYKLTETKRSL